MASRPLGRRIRFGLLAIPMLAGCHAAGMNNLATRPEPVLPKVSLSANEAIQRHNINASRVQALEARPRIKVTSPGLTAGVDGRMALERPRNFKLEMFSPAHATVADIGSNDDEFWFWARGDKRDNAVYVCNYEDLGKTPISAAFQPDWVVEAMGLKSISREEASKITSKDGDATGTIELISNRRSPSGEVLTKTTIIDHSGRVREHRLSQGNKTLAHASVSDYATFNDPNKPGEPVYLPSKFRLEWIPEQLTLDVTLLNVKLNQPVTDDQRQARFAEPRPSGTRRQNLADLVAPTQARSMAEPDEAPVPTPRTRSSRPIPPSGAAARASAPDVQLGAPVPEPLGVEGAGRTVRDPVSLSPDLGVLPSARPVDQVVRPGVPTPGDQ